MNACIKHDVREARVPGFLSLLQLKSLGGAPYRSRFVKLAGTTSSRRPSRMPRSWTGAGAANADEANKAAASAVYLVAAIIIGEDGVVVLAL